MEVLSVEWMLAVERGSCLLAFLIREVFFIWRS